MVHSLVKVRVRYQDPSQRRPDTRNPGRTKAQKSAEDPHQVHHQEHDGDGGLAGARQLGHDAVEGVPTLPPSEHPLHRLAVGLITCRLPGDGCPFRGVLEGSAGADPRQADPPLATPGTVGTRPVDPVCEDALGVVAMAIAVRRGGGFKIHRLVVGIPLHALDEGESIGIACRHLGAPLEPFPWLGSANGPDVGLRDAVDAIRNRLHSFAVHLPLLGVDEANRLQLLNKQTPAGGQVPGPIRYQTIDMPEIPPDILQLLPFTAAALCVGLPFPLR